MSETATGRRPRTVWEHCLVGADLLVRARVRAGRRDGRLSLEQEATWVGPDLPVTLVLLAAGVHQQIGRQGLGYRPRSASVVWLHSPEGGVQRVLRSTPYAALQAAPGTEHGCAERQRLLRAAVSGHPDTRLLWDRARTAALSVLEGVVTDSQDASVTLADVLAGEKRQQHEGGRELGHPAARVDGNPQGRPAP